MGTQQQAKLPRVGVIANGSPDTLFEAVRQSFAQHGYVEGRNIVIEARFAQGHLDRVPELVAELVDLNVDIIVSLGAVGPAAAQKANTKLPIVFVAVIDPVAVGFAATLERPGGNITGITTFDPQQATKQLELLRQVIPNLARLAILSDEDIPRVEGWNPLEKANDRAARALGLRPQWLKVKGPIPDLEGAPSDDVSGRPADVGSGGLDRLRDRPSRYVTANTRVCGEDFRGRQTGRLADRGPDAAYTDIQSQDGSDNWCDDSARAAQTGGSSHRVNQSVGSEIQSAYLRICLVGASVR